MTVTASRPASGRSAVGSVKSGTRKDSSARVPKGPTGSFVDRCDVKHLSEELEAARVAAEDRRRQEKAKAAKDLAAQNRVWRARIASAGKKGRDDKALTAEQEKMREEAEKKRRAEKQAREKSLAEENKEAVRRLQKARSAGRDVKELSLKEEQARAAASARRMDEKARNLKLLAEDNKKYTERLRQASARGRDVKELSEEIEAARAAKERERLAAKKAARRALAAYNREMHRRLFPEDNLDNSFGLASEVSFDSTDDGSQGLRTEVSLLASELDVEEIKRIVDSDRETQQQATRAVMDKVAKMQREREAIMKNHDDEPDPHHSH
mmetsp:Transcript_18842/g.52573  ORF Transcript_18842/g.52573 Transcript_18842/m.52573 type:complete len:325 (+) Transcript_18842:198-1172(+)|eukprot:CAMPEP_0117674758 /NCGR_PEP_ID=MMETSP0804-20121206/15216_1 /TAXON_ID=1074897 /ORGANISM="Tetraselmis astigmatica, Strain CCMP880" /LENGTH=324 /DNA_ID=CAMNT_0005483663 /DNA_START=187 /DNA_END=1161 /DNA_ORIENTATION=+